MARVALAIAVGLTSLVVGGSSAAADDARVASSVRIEFASTWRGVVRGTLASPSPACLHRRVRVFRIEGDEMTFVGSDATDDAGAWAVFGQVPGGPYVAVAPAQLPRGEDHACERAVSDRFRHTPGCATEHEYRQVERGWSRRRVHRLFDTRGRPTFGKETRNYELCEPYGIVQVRYDDDRVVEKAIGYVVE